MFAACVTYVHIVSKALSPSPVKQRWRVRCLCAIVVTYWVLANAGVVEYTLNTKKKCVSYF